MKRPSKEERAQQRKELEEFWAERRKAFERSVEQVAHHLKWIVLDLYRRDKCLEIANPATRVKDEDLEDPHYDETYTLSDSIEEGKVNVEISFDFHDLDPRTAASVIRFLRELNRKS